MDLLNSVQYLWNPVKCLWKPYNTSLETCTMYLLNIIEYLSGIGYSASLKSCRVHLWKPVEFLCNPVQCIL